VCRQTVSRWAKRLAEYSDEEAWRRRRLGRPARLSSEQKIELLSELMAYYRAPSRAKPGRTWSLRQVAQLIEERFGVSYSLGQVSAILTKMVGVPWNTIIFWTNAREQLFREKDGSAP
jgi:transposase